MYKIDDLAVILENVTDHEFQIGEIVKVKSLDYQGRVFACSNLGGSAFWFIDQREIRRLSDNELEFINRIDPKPDSILLELEED